MVGAGILQGCSVDDAAVFDVLRSPVVPSTGAPASSAVSESAASQMVPATSIGMFSRLVSSHRSAKSKEINCGDVSDVSWEASMQLILKNYNCFPVAVEWKLWST